MPQNNSPLPIPGDSRAELARKIILAVDSVTASVEAGGSNPTGPAGGDLGEDYPNPSVQSVSGQFTSSTAYVESYGSDLEGQLNNPYRPFLTVQAALNAGASTSIHLVVRIGDGIFDSPVTGARSNVSYIGSGTPSRNNSGSALQNGTILLGPWVPALAATDSQNIFICNLGCDVGSDWQVTNGNVPAAAALVVGAAENNLVQNIVVENVVILGTEDSLHGITAEGVADATFDKVTTYNCIHGLACKGLNGIVTNSRFYDYVQDGLIIKSGDGSLESHEWNVSDCDGSCSQGICINIQGVAGGDEVLSCVNINNINYTSRPSSIGASYGVYVDSSNNVNVSNVTARGRWALVASAVNSSYVKFTDCQGRSSGSGNATGHININSSDRVEIKGFVSVDNANGQGILVNGTSTNIDIINPKINGANTGIINLSSSNVNILVGYDSAGTTNEYGFGGGGGLFNVFYTRFSQTFSPTTGSTVNYINSSGDLDLFLTPAGTLAALTVTLPSDVSSRIGQICTFACTQDVTTLTINGALFIQNNVTSLVSDQVVNLKKYAANTWYVTG